MNEGESIDKGDKSKESECITLLALFWFFIDTLKDALETKTFLNSTTACKKVINKLIIIIIR